MPSPRSSFRLRAYDADWVRGTSDRFALINDSENNPSTLNRLFMSLKILAYEETSLGLLCLRQRELISNPGVTVTEVTLNHEFLMSSYLTESERALSYLGLERCLGLINSRKLTAMVGGLGLGYTANELLKSDSVLSVEVVEFLPQVIGWTKDGLIPLAEHLNSDSRLTITQGDVYARLGSQSDGIF